MIFSLATASVISPGVNNASLANENPLSTYFDITQFGMPGDDNFVFCHEHDCQHRTIKHIFIAEITKPTPLIMPEPVKAELPEVTKLIPSKPASHPKKRKPKKPIKKKTVSCVVEK